MTEAVVNVQVKLFGHLRQTSPGHTIDIRVAEGASVADLLTALVNLLGNKFGEALLDSQGNLHGGIEVVLNEEHLPARKIRSISLTQNSTIYLVPMIEGGSEKLLTTNLFQDLTFGKLQEA